MNCSVQDCESPVRYRSLCNKHLIRVQRHGTTEQRIAEPGEPLATLGEWVANRDRTTGCWEWPYSTTSTGYGQVWCNQEHWKAHRLAAHLDGRTPGTLFVCHTCDNRRCVNPAHLFLGTVQDNTDDMMSKGRVSRGESRSKLHAGQVLSVRELLAEGEQQKSVAKRFGVSPATISDIANGRSWGWLS